MEHIAFSIIARSFAVAFTFSHQGRSCYFWAVLKALISVHLSCCISSKILFEKAE
jgi:hypothetical protein